MPELYHWGYIKRWKENGEWKYLYPDDVGGKKYSNPTGVAKSGRGAFGTKREGLNTEQKGLLKSGSASSGLKVYKDAVPSKNSGNQSEQSGSDGGSGSGYEPGEYSTGNPAVDKQLNKAKQWLSAKELQELRVSELKRRVSTGVMTVRQYSNLRAISYTANAGENKLIRRG